MTRQSAINEKCKDCIYDSLAGGTWLAQVEGCTDTKCSLHEYRPKTAATKKKEREKAFLRMTPEEQVKYREKQEKAREIFLKSATHSI